MARVLRDTLQHTHTTILWPLYMLAGTPVKNWGFLWSNVLLLTQGWGRDVKAWDRDVCRSWDVTEMLK